MPLLTKKIELFENHGRECMQAAGPNNDPKRREMLLKLARGWLKGAEALRAVETRQWARAQGMI
jgi:hypothetical protein